MEELTIDCKTGERTRRKLTPKEVAAREAAVTSDFVGEKLLRQEYDEAVKRLRDTQIGRDILTLLGVVQ